MTQIDFYFNVADKNALLHQLLLGALAKKRQATLAVNDENAAKIISQQLWQFEASSFVPHVLENHADTNQTQIIIGWQHQTLHNDDMLVNMCEAEPSFFSRFKQLVEIVGEAEADKANARKRYKFYRDRGYQIRHHDETQPK